MRRVAIIGGGLSGLSAAFQLMRDGQAEPTIFEASSRLGGIVETVRRDGFVIECGPDSWVTEKPWLRELAIELGLGAELLPSNDEQRRTYLLQQGQLTPMPDGMRMMVPTELAPVMASPLFSAEARLAYQRELQLAPELRASPLPGDEDESVASFVRRHFGDEVARTVAAPLLSGVFGGDIERLSVRAVMPAFVSMEREHGSLIAALQSRAREGSSAVFTTLRSGLGTLIERLAAALTDGCVRMGNRAIDLSRLERGWRLHTIDSEEIFDAVILATPPGVARGLLRHIHEQFDGLLAMEATSAIVVALAFTPEHMHELSIPRGFGYLVPQHPGDGSQLLACTFLDQKFPHSVPDGGILLRGFFGGAAAAELLDQPDEILSELAVRRIGEALGLLPKPYFSVVRRWPSSLPQYAVGHLSRMARLRALVATFPGLHLAGNTCCGVGLPDVVREGRQAARQAAHS